MVEERLLVGKREVSRGSVRVRSYMVEEPVHEEVSLREERVNVERRPVNEPTRPVVKGSADDLMQERTIELSETAEQAVVGKEARVTEQVVVSKDTRERVESIDDTVRRTKVDIEDGRQADRTAKGAAKGTEIPPRNAPPPGRVWSFYRGMDAPSRQVPVMVTTPSVNRNGWGLRAFVAINMISSLAASLRSNFAPSAAVPA